jgi:fusion and transport protein UGO1
MTADILTASSPLATLVLSFISSSLSALILAPIDTARTFLMLTPATHGPRSLVRAIRQLPTPNCTIPSHLVPITVLHSSLPNLIMTSTPLFLKSYLSIDPLLNPNAWNLCAFLGSGLELAVRFPLETVLRRAQIATYTSLSLRQKSSNGSIRAASIDASDVETIVPTPRTYRGIIGTMWHVVYEEGVSSTPSEKERAKQLLGQRNSQQETRKRQQGQGIQGLYRGWRIGMWGIAGIWGASLLGGFAGGNEDEVTTRGGHGRSSGGRF